MPGQTEYLLPSQTACLEIRVRSESVSCSVLLDSLQIYRQSPSRLLCPWNSPGRNAGVGSHSLLQGIFLTQGLNPGLLHCRRVLYRGSQREAHGRGAAWWFKAQTFTFQKTLLPGADVPACQGPAVVSDSEGPHGLQPTGLCPWDSPAKNTGVGCHALLQGIFPTQRLNPRLLHLLRWQAGS